MSERANKIEVDGVSKVFGDPAKGFRATFEKIPQGDGYTMNHTAGVLLFHDDGRFGGIVDYHEERRFALPKIRRVLK